MSVFHPDQIRAMRSAADTPKPVALFAQNWQNLHDQAQELAKLAQLAPEPFEGDIADLPVRLSRAGDATMTLAWQGLEDMDAMMQPGLTALRTITARGQAATVPALALWREFHCARGALLRLAPAAGDTPDHRDAA